MYKDAAQLPLATVARYTRSYPGIWDICEAMRNIPEEQWDRDRCYIPIAAALAIRMHYNMPDEAIYLLPALAAWRRWKEVYTFDLTLEQLLYDQSADTKLPTDVIMAIPFPCIYISAQKYRFFAHLENDVNDGRWELRFARLMEDGTTRAYFLHLGDFTIEESLCAVLDESSRVMRDVIPNNPAMQKITEGPTGLDYADSLNADAIREMLQLYLYVCASNADIRQDQQTRKTYRPRGNGKVTDKYREVRKWETGYYIGAKIRKADHAAPSANPGTGTAKRPHIRRGHWHHFWKGSGADRHLELHWVFPLMVHGDDQEAPVRITDV